MPTEKAVLCSSVQSTFHLLYTYKSNPRICSSVYYKESRFFRCIFFKMHRMCFILSFTFEIFHVMPGEIPINVIAAFPMASG